MSIAGFLFKFRELWSELYVHCAYIPHFFNSWWFSNKTSKIIIKPFKRCAVKLNYLFSHFYCFLYYFLHSEILLLFPVIVVFFVSYCPNESLYMNNSFVAHLTFSTRAVSSRERSLSNSSSSSGLGHLDFDSPEGQKKYDQLMQAVSGSRSGCKSCKWAHVAWTVLKRIQISAYYYHNTFINVYPVSPLFPSPFFYVHFQVNFCLLHYLHWYSPIIIINSRIINS